MATVTPVPFAVALLVGLAAFAALTYYLVQDSRRPDHWPEHACRRAAARTAAPAHHPRDRGAGPMRKVGAPGSWSLVATFVLRSRWSTGAPTGSTRITDARRRYDATRSAWVCAIVDTISSSTPVRSTSCLEAGAHRRHVADRRATRVQSLDELALERREVCTPPPRPASGTRRDDPGGAGGTRAGPASASRCACSSVSPQTTLTPRASGRARRARATAGTCGGTPRARRRASPARSGTRTSTAGRARPRPTRRRCSIPASRARACSRAPGPR